MPLKKLLFIAFFLLNYAVIGQTDSSKVEKRIYLKNQSTNQTSYYINKWDEIKIWLKGVEEPVKGFVTYANDSTLLVDGEAVAVDLIEEIRITPLAGTFLGTATLLCGGFAAGPGLYIMIQGNDEPGLSSILYFAFGGALAGVGGAVAFIGTILLVGNSKKYNLEEWEFQFDVK
jgi:hypothetical protein